MLHAILLTLSILTAQTSSPDPLSVERMGADAVALAREGRFEEAASVAEQLVSEHPDAELGYRLAGFAYLALDRNDTAIHAFNRAIDLGVDGNRRDDVIAGRAEAYLAVHNPEAAFDDARQVLGDPARDATHVDALRTGAIAAGQLRQTSTLRDYAARFAAVAPNTPRTHEDLAVFYTNVGDYDRAHDEATLARRLGSAMPSLDSVDRAYHDAWMQSLWWKVPVASAVFLVVTLLFFFLAGTALSRFEVAHLSSLDARLLREERTAGERVVDRLYNALLWYGTVLFYASVPAMLALMIATCGGLVYAMVSAGRIELRALVFIVLAGGVGVISVLRGVFGKVHDERGGTPLTAVEEPVLFDTLAEVAAVAKSQSVDRVDLEPGTGISVREEGSTLAVLLGRGRRVLTLGYGAVAGLTVGELKSILAHEYGHFSHGETRLSPVIWRIRTALLRVLQHMAAEGNLAKANPVFWYLRAYFWVYLRVTLAQSRRRELMADRVAALTYGGEVFGGALATVIELGDFVTRNAVSWLSSTRESGRRCRNVYRPLMALRGDVSAAQRLARVEPLLARIAGPFDSHPAPPDRIAAVAGIQAPGRAETTSAESLFANAEATATAMTQVLTDRIEPVLLARGIRFAPTVTDEPTDVEAFVVALGRYYEALDGVEQKKADAGATSRERLAVIESTWGERDPGTALARVELARTFLRVGKRTEALDALECAARGLATVEAEGGVAAMITFAKERRASIERSVVEVRAQR